MASQLHDAVRENGSLFPDENRGSERKVSLVRTVTGRTRIRPQVQQVPELKLLKEQNGRVQQNGIVLPKILRPSHQGCKRCSEVVGENSKDKAAGGAVWLRGRAAWSAAAARPDQSGPSHSDRALGTECPPGVLGTSEGRVTRQVVTRQHRELARCLGTR